MDVEADGEAGEQVYNAVLRLRYNGGKRWNDYTRYTRDEFGTDVSPDYTEDETGVEISFYLTDKSENILNFLRESGVPEEKLQFFNEVENKGYTE